MKQQDKLKGFFQPALIQRKRATENHIIHSTAPAGKITIFAN